jgi:hypothetical protein
MDATAASAAAVTANPTQLSHGRWSPGVLMRRKPPVCVVLRLLKALGDVATTSWAILPRSLDPLEHKLCGFCRLHALLLLRL